MVDLFVMMKVILVMMKVILCHILVVKLIFRCHGEYENLTGGKSAGIVLLKLSFHFNFCLIFLKLSFEQVRNNLFIV